MDNNVYAPPTSELINKTETNPTESVLANRSSRFWAAIIDGLTVIPVTLPLMYFTGGFDEITGGIAPSFVYTLIMALIGTAAFLVIHGKILIRDGQTWGKKALNIKIVTMDDQHPDVITLVKRFGFYWLLPQIPVIGQVVSTVNILFIFTTSRRCLHDRIAATKVVKIQRTNEEPLASGRTADSV